MPLVPLLVLLLLPLLVLPLQGQLLLAPRLLLPKGQQTQLLALLLPQVLLRGQLLQGLLLLLQELQAPRAWQQRAPALQLQRQGLLQPPAAAEEAPQQAPQLAAEARPGTQGPQARPVRQPLAWGREAQGLPAQGPQARPGPCEEQPSACAAAAPSAAAVRLERPACRWAGARQLPLAPAAAGGGGWLLRHRERRLTLCRCAHSSP